MIIKRFPGDFRVEEMLTREAGRGILPRNPGPFVLYRLTKRGLGTDEALDMVSRALSVSPDALSAVGLKDKHAVTTQYLTLEAAAVGAAEPPEVVESGRWKLEHIGWLPDRLRHADVAGNRFGIVTRRLDRRRWAQLESAARFLAASPRGTRTLRFVNYFGEQRFGSARHGRGFAARHLIRGEFEKAMRLLVATPSRKDSREVKLVKRAMEATVRTGGTSRRRDNARARAAFAALPQLIRRLAIEAYQSWLWNEIAGRVALATCEPPFISVSTPYGRLAFPRGAAAAGPLAELAIPLLSPRSSLDEPWGTAAEEVLAAEGITVADLRIPGLREPYFGEAPRAFFADATEVSLGPLEADESVAERRMFKRRLRFFLPRGSYATVLLRALGGEVPGESKTPSRK
jgi:tRNA pseudouridine13 synthase